MARFECRQHFVDQCVIGALHKHNKLVKQATELGYSETLDPSADQK